MVEKIKWVLAVFIVFLVILGTNLIDRRNFNQLKGSVETIYNDRIVASDLIYRMADLLRKREIVVVTGDTINYNAQLNAFNNRFEDFIAEYRNTKLTELEQIELGRVVDAEDQLSRAESQYVISGQYDLQVVIKRYDQVYEHMDLLSNIQLEESARQKRISEKAMDTVELFTNVEIYMLVFLAVLAQIIILYRSKQGIDDPDPAG